MSGEAAGDKCAALTDLGVRCYLRRPASEGPKPETQIFPRSRGLNSVRPLSLSSPLMKSKKTTDVLNCRYLYVSGTPSIPADGRSVPPPRESYRSMTPVDLASGVQSTTSGIVLRARATPSRTRPDARLRRLSVRVPVFRTPGGGTGRRADRRACPPPPRGGCARHVRGHRARTDIVSVINPRL